MTRFTEREYAEVLERTRRKSRGEPRRTATLPPMSEKDFQQNVKDLARMLGWKTYHTLNSKGSDEDFPDLVMAKRRNIGTICPEFETRLIVAELKIEGKKPTAGQQEWLDFFRDIGAETYAWQPHDWERIQKVLR